jgi:hypothetical protein
MQRRVTHNQDSIDLLIAGVEASLWLAEQCAADLRRVFPYLNVSTISANKSAAFCCLWFCLCMCFGAVKIGALLSV